MPRIGWVLLSLALSGCGLLGNGSPSTANVATPGTGQPTPVIASPSVTGLSSQPATPSSAQLVQLTGDPTLKPATTLDPSQRLEYQDLTVDQTDPSSTQTLVPYLLSKEWRIVQVEMLSPTSRHWRFMRITTSDGRSLPTVDPLLMPKQDGTGLFGGSSSTESAPTPRR